MIMAVDVGVGSQPVSQSRSVGGALVARASLAGECVRSMNSSAGALGVSSESWGRRCAVQSCSSGSGRQVLGYGDGEERDVSFISVGTYICM